MTHAATTITLAAGGQAFLLPAMVLIPVLCGFGMAVMPASRPALVRWMSLGVSLLLLVLALGAAAAFDWSDPGTFQLTSHTRWMPGLGIAFSLGVDAVSLWLILLTTFLMPLTILGTWGDGGERLREYHLWLLVLAGALVGVFAAMDLILFYVCFEMTLVPLFFLIGIFGSTQRRHAAGKFFIFTLAGSVFTFAGVLYVAYFHASLPGTTWTFHIPQLAESAREMSLTQQGWVLLALFAGFAVKVPLFPVHTWLPLAHTEAPTAASVMLAGVLLKLGTYGLLRFALPMAPAAVVEAAPLVGVVCVIAILYAALICWVQEDFKKLVAYSSISHMGFCVLGLFALNREGVAGSVVYMISHGLSTGALFLCVGMVYQRYHTRQLPELGGLGRKMPIWSTFLVIFTLASVGIPGLNGFVGEFLTLLGAFRAEGVLGVGYAACAVVGVIFAAIYLLYMVGCVVMGPLREPAEYAEGVQDLNAREIAALAPLALACLVLGLYPKPLLAPVDGSFDQLTAGVQQVLAERKAAQQPQAGITKLDTLRPPSADSRASANAPTHFVFTAPRSRLSAHGSPLTPQVEGSARRPEESLRRPSSLKPQASNLSEASP